MIRIILIGSEKENYAAVKNIILQLDFLFENDLKLISYKEGQQELNAEIKLNEQKKVYLIFVKANNQEALLKIVKLIRENDWYSEIILLKSSYVTLNKSWKYMQRIFSVIDMNIDDNRVLKDNLKLIMDHLCEEKSFRFKNRDMNLNIYFGRILYIYRDTKDRKVVVVTDTNTYSLNMGLKDTFSLLDRRFRQVHRACVVNTMRTEKFDWNHNRFILDNGDEIDMLSKHYRDNIEDFMDFKL